MGHHNLQQIYLRDFGIELSHTVIPCCSGLRSAPYGSQIPLIPPHVFIIVACYIYNKNNGMVILWSSFFFSIRWNPAQNQVEYVDRSSYN